MISIDMKMPKSSISSTWCKGGGVEDKQRRGAAVLPASVLLPLQTRHLVQNQMGRCHRLTTLETENKQLRQISSELEAVIKRLEGRITVLEKGQSSTSAAIPVVCTAQTNGISASADEEEDDFELFGDDNEEEDADAERIKQERVKAYEDRKANKPVLIAKSNIILDVKPWDDETDMVELEKCVRSIEMDGLLWGSSKLVPLAYTIKKLQISCVVEDDKVSTDDLEEKILAFEELIQSIDIAAFNKI